MTTPKLGWGRKAQWFGPLSLLMIAIFTRWPLWGPSEGEPDTARFVIAVWQWIRYGPKPAHGVVTFPYYPVLAPGYFALCARLAAWTHTGAAGLPWLLNGVSGAAAIVSAPLLYRLGRRFLPAQVAWMAALLFLLSPAFWWQGIEAHPQGLAFLFFLLAADCYVAAETSASTVRWTYFGASTLALTVCLLFRCDTMLLLPVFPAAVFVARGRAAWKMAVLRTGAIGAVASGLFLGLRCWILGIGPMAAQRATDGTVERFLGHSSALHQLLPFFTAPGPAVCGFALAGWALLAISGKTSRHAVWALAIVPSAAFWLIITGNNVRHVSELWLPVFWAGCMGWRMRAPGWMLPAGLACLMCNFWIVPANSNLTNYPSPNVVASHRMTATQQRQVAAMARELEMDAAQSPATACFLGSGTPPYLLQALIVNAAPAETESVNQAWTRVRWPEATGQAARPAWVGFVYSDQMFADALARCPRPLSLEYALPDRHIWYFGSQLNAAPWVARIERWGHTVDMKAIPDTGDPAVVNPN